MKFHSPLRSTFYCHLFYLSHMNLIRIAVVDDHEVVRSGLLSLINTWKGVKVVGDFDSGEALLNAPEVLANTDVLILDNQLKGMSGAETFLDLRKRGWDKPVIMLTVSENDEQFKILRNSGIYAIFLKSIKADILKQKVFEAAGEPDFDDGFAQNVLEKISPREMEFIQFICDEQEFTYDQIADLMNVHVRTVDSFRKSLFHKLNIKSKTGLVMFAMKTGLASR
jgi:two-component system, NarL family, invasion response regulator UvrY